MSCLFAFEAFELCTCAGSFVFRSLLISVRKSQCSGASCHMRRLCNPLHLPNKNARAWETISLFPTPVPVHTTSSAKPSKALPSSLICAMIGSSPPGFSPPSSFCHPPAISLGLQQDVQQRYSSHVLYSPGRCPTWTA